MLNLIKLLSGSLVANSNDLTELMTVAHVVSCKDILRMLIVFRFTFLQGAKHVTTFDYVKIKSEHPQVETLTPNELSQKFLDGIRYDLMVTYSSLEHSGLGR